MTTRIANVALALLLVLNLAALAPAAPITGGTGPGGVGLSDGSSNLQAWFKAETLGLGGGASVAAWSDSSGNGNGATDLGNVANQPTFQTAVHNGFPVVRFDGTDVLGTADTGAFLGNQPFTVVGAFSVNNFGAGQHQRPLFAIGNDAGEVNDRRVSHLAFESPTSTVNRLYGGAITYSTSIGTSTLRTMSNRYLGSDLNGYGLQIDGTSQTASGGNTNTHNFTIGEIRLGDQSPGNSDAQVNFDGDIAEIAFFNRALNSAELVIVDNYFAAKYDKNGAGAIANDVYAGDLNSNGDYDLDVFGVGRNVTDVVTNSGSAGFGIEATSGIADDGDYILAGHNVTVNGRTEDDVPAGLTDRWERVWYVDKTDADDDVDVTLSFDFSDAGLSEPTVFESEFALLFSDMEPLSFVEIPGLTETIDGDTVSFLVPAAILADGYYTLGIFTVPEPSTAVLLLLGLVGMTAHARRRRSRG